MKTNITKVLVETFGVGPVVANWTTVTWAVAEVAKEMGTEFAAKEMKKINALRGRHGVYTNIPEYGTDLYRAYFAK